MTDGLMQVGRDTYALPAYDDGQLMSNLESSGLLQKSGAQTDETPKVGDDYGYSKQGIQVIKRDCHRRGGMSSVDLKTLRLNSPELATVTKKIRDEMYRNEFPVFVARFNLKCQECGAKYDSDVSECEKCGSEDLQSPDETEKHETRDLFRSVNAEEQDLRHLFEYLEDQQSTFGMSLCIIRKSYNLTKKSGEFSGTEVRVEHELEEGVEELVPGDPRRIVPIAAEGHRVGGVYACPFHRDEDHHEKQGQCPECSCPMKEVYFTQLDSRGKLGQLFFRDEVVWWARHFPLKNGLDARSPLAPLVQTAAILHYNRIYNAAFFDPDNDDLPNKLLLINTDNPDSLRAALKGNEDAESQSSGDTNPFKTGMLVNQLGASDSNASVEVVDTTPTDVLKNQDRTIDRYQSMIRSMFGVSDAMDNELSQSGGLNSEGLQLEVTNQAVASAHQDTRPALEKIAREIGLTDWRLDFVNPERDTEQLNQVQIVSAINQAETANVDWELQDGNLIFPDQTSDTDDPSDGEETV